MKDSFSSASQANYSPCIKFIESSRLLLYQDNVMIESVYKKTRVTNVVYMDKPAFSLHTPTKNWQEMSLNWDLYMYIRVKVV